MNWKCLFGLHDFEYKTVTSVPDVVILQKRTCKNCSLVQHKIISLCNDFVSNWIVVHGDA
jgi:hypothetical protein